MQLKELWRNSLTTSTIETHAWDGFILYIFLKSILSARHRATTHPEALVCGTDVADMPRYGLSLVWMDNTPYLFPGSLTAASERGKTQKGVDRTNAALALYHRRLEASGFAGQYGNGIGEGGRPVDDSSSPSTPGASVVRR